MTQLTIFHNPRCSKSRQTLALLEQHGCEITVVEYLKQPPTVLQLTEILRLLNLEPRQLMRTKEDLYKELNLGDSHCTDQQLIAAMHTNPKLIERPIVLANSKAAIGRPPEQVLSIL